MNNHLKDRLIHSLLKTGKKNKILKIPVLFLVALILSCSRFFAVIYGNSKRILVVTCLMLFFSISSSFASINFVTTNPSVITDNETANADSVSDSMVLGNATSSDEEIHIIEDSEVIDGYEDTDINNGNTDFYSVDEILNQNNMEQVSGNYAETQIKKTTFDKEDWRLILINKQHPVPDDYQVTLGTITGNMKCDKRIIENVLKMFQAAKNDGVNLVICSPYRDYKRQSVLFDRKINAYMKNGMSYMEAYKITSQAVTVPGASEHQIGIALDIICDSYSLLDENFGETEAGKWLSQHCCEYGFILRYPKGKEYITSIEYEPWHFRYVGSEAATIIMEQGITLEEFIENL